MAPPYHGQCTPCFNKRPNKPLQGIRVCTKEGCEIPLSRYQKKRCSAHRQLCVKMNCTKKSRPCSDFCIAHKSQFKSTTEGGTHAGRSGPKSNHRTNESSHRKVGAKKDRSLCIKEGCKNTLKPHQSKRCSEHLMKCIHIGCTSYFVEGSGGYCVGHARSPNNLK